MSNAVWMRTNCPLSCGVCLDPSAARAIEDPYEVKMERRKRRLKKLKEGGGVQQQQPRGKAAEEACADVHESCGGWFELGECESNPEFMGANCRQSCGLC